MDIGVGLLVSAVLGMVGLNSRRIGKLDDRVDESPRIYLTKADFNRFDDRLFQELKEMREDIKDASK